MNLHPKRVYKRCPDCGHTHYCYPNSLRCSACKKERKAALQREGFYGRNLNGHASRRKLTEIHTERQCRVCGNDIIHYQDKDGLPVGPQDYYTCVSGDCKVAWKRHTEGVAEEFWGFAPETPTILSTGLFPGHRTGGRRAAV